MTSGAIRIGYKGKSPGPCLIEGAEGPPNIVGLIYHKLKCLKWVSPEVVRVSGKWSCIRLKKIKISEDL